MRFRTCASLVALMAGLPLSAQAAWAQSEDSAAVDQGAIIVTAQRRAEAQVDVPISITSIGADQLATANISELTSISKVTPALRFDFAGPFFQPTIRGIGTAVVTSGGGGNVGIYVDGFYSPNPLATDFDLISVKSIQVLKGPQGTLFGRNTTGGAILVQTREPDVLERSLEMRASYGRFNEFKGQAFFNTPISDSVAMTVEGQYRRGNGFQTNISTGKRVGDYENWSVRLSMKADLTDDVSLLLRYKHGKVDDPSSLLPASFADSQFGQGAPFGGIPGTYTNKPNEVALGSHPSDQEYFHSNSDVLQATLTADLGFADFTSYTQYRNEKVDSSFDSDYSGVEILQFGLPNNNDTWSQEFLLTSKAGPPLQWTAGLFYFENTDHYITYYDYFPVLGITSRTRAGGSSTTVKSYAAFLDATYELTPKLFVTAGVRYSRDKVVDAYYNLNAVFTGAATEVPVPSISNGKVTPRVVLRYKPVDEMSVYASFAKGYKAAILDVGGSCQVSPYVCNDVKPEDVNAYELGAKYEAGGLSLEGAAFYYDYKNLQVSIFRDATASIVNAAKSEIYGLEAQMRYRVTPRFQFLAGGSYVHARYKNFSYVDASGNLTGAPIYTRCPAPSNYPADCTGLGTFYVNLDTPLKNVPMQRTPEFTGFLGARYDADLAGGTLALSGNLSYSSSFYFGPSGTQFRQPGYETLSLRAEWTDPSDTYSLALWGDNVTDSRYLTAVQYGNFGIGANWNKPVTYGVEVGVKF